MKHEFAKFLIIVICITGCGIAYGIINDIITASYCIEYYDHFDLVKSDNPIIIALVYGILTTWWCGLIAGIVLAFASRAGADPAFPTRQTIKYTAIGLSIALVFSHLVGFIAKSMMSDATILKLFNERKVSIEVMRRFVYVDVVHTMGYLGALVGGLILRYLILTMRKKGHISDTNANPSTGSAEPENLHKISTQDSENEFSIVFLHGVDGHWRETWHPSHRPDLFWPNWLCERFPEASVWSMHYHTSTIKWSGDAMPLQYRAQNIVNFLKNKNILSKPVIIIAHSFGGLVAKQLWKLSYDYSDNDIKSNLRGIIFIATPHLGAKLADYLNTVLVRAIARPTVVAKDLEYGSTNLLSLNNWYNSNPVELNAVYFEQLPTRFRNTVGVRVVDDVSAQLGLHGSFLTSIYPIPISSDHIQICKPDSSSAQIFESVVRDIQTMRQKWRKARDVSSTLPQSSQMPSKLSLSDLDLTYEAEQLIVEASLDPIGEIGRRVATGSSRVFTNGNIMNDTAQHSFAKWSSAIDELESMALIKPRNQEGTLFEVTGRGLQYIDQKMAQHFSAAAVTINRELGNLHQMATKKEYSGEAHRKAVEVTALENLIEVIKPILKVYDLNKDVKGIADELEKVVAMPPNDKNLSILIPLVERLQDKLEAKIKPK